MHFLVIEDERALCETIVRSLRRLAYSVDCCYDGEKALELLGVERYDLVLLDLNLPGKDGMTVLRTLRGFGLRHALPHRFRQWSGPDADPQGNGDIGIFNGTSGATGESGGADGSCLGQQRGQLQQLHPGTYLRSAQKTACRTGL